MVSRNFSLPSAVPFDVAAVQNIMAVGTGKSRFGSSGKGALKRFALSLFESLPEALGLIPYAVLAATLAMSLCRVFSVADWLILELDSALMAVSLNRLAIHPGRWVPEA